MILHHNRQIDRATAGSQPHRGLEYVRKLRRALGLIRGRGRQIGQDACAGCTVEVFENSDTDGEGETYVGSAIADSSGHFTVTVTYLTKPYLTATATDARGTSEFSEVFEATVPLAPPVGPVFLPIILRNY